MTDIKELMDNITQELAEEQKDPKNKAIKEILRVERNDYYSAKKTSRSLGTIREIVNKYATERKSGDAN